MEHYSYKKITERIYLIIASYGGHNNVMQLVLGNEKAAIIDTGMGATGNLREYIKEITDLPVTCFLTHMHPDHAGAAVLFDTVYMNPADEIHCWWALSKETRLRDLADAVKEDPEITKVFDREMTDNSSFTFTPMFEGDRFDLGGISLEVFSAVGHTEGSVVLFCPEENALFGGDAIAPRAMLVGEHRPSYTSMEYVYKDLKNIEKHTNKCTKFFCGHAPKALPPEVLSDLISAIEKVMDGTAKAERAHGRFTSDEPGNRTFTFTEGLVNLTYSEASLAGVKQPA